MLKAGRDKNRCLNCVVTPFEQGLLLHEIPFEGLGKKDLRQRNPYFRDKGVLDWLTEYRRLSVICRLPKACVVLLWILAHDFVDIVIPGPRTESQLDELLLFCQTLRNLGCEKPTPDQVVSLIGQALWDHLGKSSAKVRPTFAKH